MSAAADRKLHGLIARRVPEPAALIRFSRAAAVLFGIIHAWRSRYVMYPDTVSYLDLGERFVNGDWIAPFNSHWSCGYSICMGICTALFGGSPEREVVSIHVFGFFCYLAALLSFERLLRVVGDRLPKPIVDHSARVPALSYSTLLLVLCYPIFSWAALTLITLATCTPDMLVFIGVMLATASLVRIKQYSMTRDYLALGMWLGISYWFKNVMFVVGLIYLGTAGLIAVRQQRLLSAAAGVMLFVLIVSPLVLTLSFLKQRPTFGDSGRLNYAWFVNGVTPNCHWQGEPGGRYGTPSHPTRIIREVPRIYEFGRPILGTYAVWTDPTYWYEGIQPIFDFRQQSDRLIDVMRDYGREFLIARSSFLAVPTLIVFCALSILAERLQSTVASMRILLRHMLASYELLLPSLAVLSMFGLIYVLPRYVGAFVFVALVALLQSIPWRLALAMRHVFLAGAVTLWCFLAVETGRTLADQSQDDLHCRVAELLPLYGVDRGDAIGHIGNSFRAYWARFAGVRIVAEIRPRDASVDFWTADQETRKAAFDGFRRAGATAVITQRAGAPEPPWERIGETDYFIAKLSSPEP